MREDVIAALRKMIVNDLFVEIPEDQIGLGRRTPERGWPRFGGIRRATRPL